MENNPLLDISQISGRRGNKTSEEMQKVTTIYKELLQKVIDES